MAEPESSVNGLDETGQPISRSFSYMSLESHPAMKGFVVHAKDNSLDNLEHWRKLCLVLNATRRFRYCANTERRRRTEDHLKSKRKFRIFGIVARAGWRFHDALRNGSHSYDTNTLDMKHAYGFDIDTSQLLKLMEGDVRLLKYLGGVEGLAIRLKSSTKEGIIDNIINNEESDVNARQAVFGSNTYPEKPPKGFWMFFWEAMQDLTLAILAICAVVSVSIGVIVDGWEEGWYDGAGIVFSILLVVFVTAVSDYKQSLQFSDLDREKKKIFVDVIRNNRRQHISIFKLLVGDLVHLGIGDQVPADGVFVSGSELKIDESSMTGESGYSLKNEDHPFLLSGTKVQDGSALMMVTSVGMNTEWGHLMAALGQSDLDETPLQVKLNGVATLIGKMGCVFAVVTFSVLMIRYLVVKESLLEWSAADALITVNFFAIAVTIIVVAVPEGLPLAVTLTLAFAMKKMMADKALVRHLSACETMGSATTICSDKTGTLTTNKMTVVRSWIGGAVRDAYKVKIYLPTPFLRKLLECTFRNTSGDIEENENGMPPTILGSPTETAVLRFGLALGGNYKLICSQTEVVKTVPFNSTRKKMGVIVKDCTKDNNDLERGESNDMRLCAYWKGAPELIFKLCDRYVDADGNESPFDELRRKEVISVTEDFCCDALRTLAFAYKELRQMPDDPENPIPETGFVLAAIVGIKDPVRDGVKEAVRLCTVAGIKVRMVTGDNIFTAKAIAKESGILTEDGIAMEGREFRNMSHSQRLEKIPHLQVMARSSPTDKLTLVRELRAMGEVVAVTGDGTNDAPALHEADVGLAMGISGTEVAKESADVVILDDNFSSIVNVVKWGRSVYTNVQKFVQFQLTVNIVALVINFTSACFTGMAPFTALQLLWVNLIMDTLGALALATEPPYEELMLNPPTGRFGNFISTVMWRNIIVQAIYQLSVLTVLQYFGEELLELHGPNATLYLNTMIFNAFVFCQVFNEINAREMESLNVFRHTLNNWIFLLILAFTVTLQFILVQFLGKFASTAPLSKEHWALTVFIGFVSLFVAALGKFIPVPKFSKHVASSEAEPRPEEQPHTGSNGYVLLTDAVTNV